MALTANELTHIRNIIGDTSTPPDLSDTYVNYLYDNNADSNIDKTIYWSLMALLGKAARKVSQSNARTGDSHSAQQWFDHLEKMIAIWGAKTGIGGATATMGTINLGIDEEDANFNIT